MHADTALTLDDIELILGENRPIEAIAVLVALRGSTSRPTARQSCVRPHWHCRRSRRAISSGT